MGDVADRPAMATGIFLVAYRRKQPCAYRRVLFNLHQLPSHRNDISNVDLGAGVKQLSASVKGGGAGPLVYWPFFALLPIGSLLKFLLARPANLPFLSARVGVRPACLGTSLLLGPPKAPCPMLHAP